MAISFKDFRPRLPVAGAGPCFSTFTTTDGLLTSIITFSSTITGETATVVFSISSTGTKSKVICDKDFPMCCKGTITLRCKCRLIAVWKKSYELLATGKIFFKLKTSTHNSLLITYSFSLIKTLVTCSRFFQQLVKLCRTKIIIEEINRINFFAVLMHFVMAMRPG